MFCVRKGSLLYMQIRNVIPCTCVINLCCSFFSPTGLLHRVYLVPESLFGQRLAWLSYEEIVLKTKQVDIGDSFTLRCEKSLGVELFIRRPDALVKSVQFPYALLFSSPLEIQPPRMVIAHEVFVPRSALWQKCTIRKCYGRRAPLRFLLNV